MYLSGFISSDYNGWAVVGDTTFADFMYDIAEEYGIAYKHNRGLGGKSAVIKNCSIMMYTSKEEMSFEEAEEKFLNYMFGVKNIYDEDAYDGYDEEDAHSEIRGVYEMEANRTGYSEWTITGFDLDKCTLGGHNLNEILLSHSGEYVNIKVECQEY